MKRAGIVILVIACLAGVSFAALKLTGVFDTGLFSGKDKGDEADEAFYVEFMDDYFIIDTEGIVLSCTGTEPAQIPLVEDMMFNSLIVGERADAASESSFEYLQTVCSLLDEYELSVERINVSDGEITIYLTETLSVCLGENEDTDVKIRDLRSLYSNLIVYDGGILYMTTADTGGQGYTFKEITSDDEADDGTGDETDDGTDETELEE